MFLHQKQINCKLNKMYKIKATDTKDLQIDKTSDKIITSSRIIVTFD